MANVREILILTKNKIKYLPFGETRSGSVPTDKQFTGQTLDDTGIYYYNARYYDPLIGRFISPDSIVQNPANPQSLILCRIDRNSGVGKNDEKYWKIGLFYTSSFHTYANNACTGKLYSESRTKKYIH